MCTFRPVRHRQSENMCVDITHSYFLFIYVWTWCMKSFAGIFLPSGKIYPSRDEYEAHQERVLARISKHNNQQALSHSIEEGLKIQAMTR